jgi:hypothetical protein
VSIEIGQEYRNSLGGVMVIKGYAALGMNVIGEIWVAESPDTLFGSVTYLVTAEGLVDAGYHKVQAATQ